MAPARRALDSYKDLCAQFYDLDKPEPPREEVDFYWRRYRRCGGPALEAMCGSGRFLIELARRGADIDGVDASPQMLDACRRKAAAAGVAPGLSQQFVQELDLPRRYRFIFIPAGSFALIPYDDQLPALRALVRHMQPGAELALEMNFPGEPADGPASADPERRVARPDGAHIVLSWEEDGRMRYDLVRDGEVVHSELETFVLHPLSRSELERLLRAAGLVDIRIWSPFGEDAAPASASSAIFVCAVAGAPSDQAGE